MKISEFANNDNYQHAVNARIEAGPMKDVKDPEVLRKYLQKAVYGPEGTKISAYKRAVDNHWDWESGVRKQLPDGSVKYYPLAGHCAFWGAGAGYGTNLMYDAAQRLVAAHK